MTLKMKNKKVKVDANKWKPVELKGSVITNDVDDFSNLIGLEIMDNYDPSFIKTSNKKRGFSVSELTGDIFDVRNKGKKFKESESNSDEDEEPEPAAKKLKKKSEKKKKVPLPGKYVLAPPADEIEPTEEELETLKSFEDSTRIAWQQIGVVSEEILKAIVEQGFSTPTEIQSLTIPQSVFGKCDILGAAETGSGKTCAFGIPIIQSIQKMLLEKDEDDDSKPLYALILTPTRELAQQVHQHLKAVAKYTSITIATVIGGLAAVKQHRVLSKHPEIVVATPGRLWEMIQEGNEHLNKIDDIKFLVVDETDRMLEKGHFEEMQELLMRINADEEKKTNRQNFIFSATLSLVHDLPDHLKTKNRYKKNKSLKITSEQKMDNFVSVFGISNPKIVDITRSDATAVNLTESRILCELNEKDFYLYYILIQHPGRTIVFSNSIECVKRLSSLLSHININALTLHGNMEQKQRLRNLERFQSHPTAILIATDVAARGLDIPNVNHVIHYQVPRTSENYIHRSGRTARAQKEGLAILLMEPSEVKYFVKLHKTLGRNEDLPIFPTDSKTMQTVRERVRLAREIEDMDLKTRRMNDEVSWQKKAADDIGIMLDSADSDSDNEGGFNKSLNNLKNQLKYKKKELGRMLSIPLVPKGISMKFPISGENFLKTYQQNEARSNPIQMVKNVIETNKQNRALKMKLYK